MGGTLLNKRYIKRKVDEEDREEGEITRCDDPQQSNASGVSIAVPRKRLKQAKAEPAPAPSEPTTSHAHKHTNHRVSFNPLSPSVVSIDGLGSEIIQRFRDSLWYTVRTTTT